MASDKNSSRKAARKVEKRRAKAVLLYIVYIEIYGKRKNYPKRVSVNPKKKG